MFRKIMLCLYFLSFFHFSQASHPNNDENSQKSSFTKQCFKGLTGHSPVTPKPTTPTTFDLFLAQLGLNRNISPVDGNSKSAQKSAHETQS